MTSTLRALVLALLASCLSPLESLSAQEPATKFVTESHIRDVDSYIVGPSDELTIAVLDDPRLAGTFEVWADLTFTCPLIGRVRAGGRTLRKVEAGIIDELTGRGLYIDP